MKGFKVLTFYSTLLIRYDNWKLKECNIYTTSLQNDITSYFVRRNCENTIL